MAKVEKHICTRCKAEFPKTKLQCPECNHWNAGEKYEAKNDGTRLLGDADDRTVELIQTGPWDACFGRRIHEDGTFTYGLPKSSVTLIGGKNGAGKSTLILQMCESICEQTDEEILYVGVEEPDAQVKNRALRLKLKHFRTRFRMTDGSKSLSEILLHRKFGLIVVDSVSKLCPQIADAVEFCKRLKGHIDELAIPAIVTGHINKEGEFAGLESLQHEVDATVMMYRYKSDDIRMIETEKNRNGLPARIMLTMADEGLIYRDPEEDEDGDEEEDDE